MLGRGIVGGDEVVELFWSMWEEPTDATGGWGEVVGRTGGWVGFP